MTSWFDFAGCNKPKIDQGGRNKQLEYHTGQLVLFLFGEVCKHTTSMDLLKSSSEELVETSSKESLLGSDDCALANFSFQLQCIKSRGSIKDKSRHVQGVLQALFVACQAWNLVCND